MNHPVLDKLREKVKAIGVTETVVRTSIPAAHIYHVLSAKGNPTLETLNKLCRATGLELVVREKPLT